MNRKRVERILLPAILLARLACPQTAPETTAQAAPGTWEGDLESWGFDHPDGSSSHVYRLRSGDQDLELYFAGTQPADLTSGTRLLVQGVRAGSQVAVTSATVVRPGRAMSSGRMTALATTTSTSTTPTCSTTGVQNMAVLLVVPPGTSLPSGVTQQSLYDVFFGTSGPSLAGYWAEASSEQASLTGNVFGPYYLTGTYSCSDLSNLQPDAFTAATNAGVYLPNYTRIFLVYPSFGCGYASGTIGCQQQSSPSGSFTASVINEIAEAFSSAANGLSYAAHEGGHNLGLDHASSRGFTPDALGPLGTEGTWTEYGDMFSTMSSCGSLGHYAAPQKAEILSWLNPSTDYQVVQSSGTWTLAPVELGSGLRALKVQRGTGNNDWLWVEYRQPLGSYDSTLNSQAFAGALIHYEDSYTGIHSNLLDFTPNTTSWLDSALAAGQTWSDPYTNVSITVQSATASGLTVSVNYGAAPCTHASPTVSMSPADPSLSPGASVQYTVSVTNNDASGCAANSFSLVSTQPSGWFGSFSAGALTLNPGQTGSAILTETAPASASTGTYSLASAATSGSYTGSGAASATVVMPTLTDTTSVPYSSYSARQTISVTSSVQYNGVAASGASVTFTLTKANGSKVTGTATTGSTGKAVWSYKVSGKDPTGTWSVTSTATYNSQTATSNTVTFSVQ